MEPIAYTLFTDGVMRPVYEEDQHDEREAVRQNGEGAFHGYHEPGGRIDVLCSRSSAATVAASGFRFPYSAFHSLSLKSPSTKSGNVISSACLVLCHTSKLG